MQVLINQAISGAEVDIDAVEAFLILSQWVSHRSPTSTAVGKGEEDKVAWMLIGNALRLAYYLGIDKVAFKSSRNANDDSVKFNRKRLVWAACYTCDRQVSVRLGKAFWSRGPGPLFGLQASDFPTLAPRELGNDDLGKIFQANLELTQIFSNVHDILYSSKDAGWKEMLDGRYSKYLDDFRYTIRGWEDRWGELECSPRLKISLRITYHYLCLYVNAFAYQATISRALTYQRDSGHQSKLPSINAADPDARFVYSAIEAALSLLRKFNDQIDVKTLRCMPICYYLFVIYSGVFLYKACLTTDMSKDEIREVPGLIQAAIERLQRASGNNSHMGHMGSRYAKLLQLLWAKVPGKDKTTGEVSAQSQAFGHSNINSGAMAPAVNSSQQGTYNNQFHFEGLDAP